ncbi:tetratricopeptide repeat (TPR)-like superfamily protein [Wolffia australiana]
MAAFLLHSPPHSTTPQPRTAHPKRNNGRTLRKSFLHQLSSLPKAALVKEAFNLLHLAEKNEGNSPSPEIYADMLQTCIQDLALFQGRQIHAHIIKKGEIFHGNEYLETKLVIFYAKCRVPEAAFKLFKRQRQRNVFSWSAMIGLLSNEGLCERALLGFRDMMAEGLSPDNFVIPCALKASSSARMTGFGAGVHGYALKTGYHGCVFVQSGLVDFYGKSGAMKDARKVFDQMPEKNTVAWNSILVGYVQNGEEEEAMRAFSEMRTDGEEPSRVTIASFLSAAASLKAVDQGRQAHAVAVLSGLTLDAILTSALINFYCKVGFMEEAEIVFGQAMEKDTVIWNLLISGYIQEGETQKALQICKRMRANNQRFDSVTLSSILSASAATEDFALGKQAHGYCIRNYLSTELSTARAIIDMYANCGRIELSRRVFNRTVNKDLILWNAQLSAYAQRGLGEEAMKLFYEMEVESVARNVVSWNTAILAMVRSNQVEEACEMLAEMESAEVKPNVVTWTTLISGLARNGRGTEAMELFRRMQASGLRPNLVSIVALASACTDVAVLRHARAMHAYSTRRGYCSSLQVSTALVDMYAKCGDLGMAERIFYQRMRRELALYNAMISGYALHGKAGEALALHAEMMRDEVSPDVVTFTGLLTACGHAGLVERGLELFFEMGSKYGLSPGVEHYGCVVALLSRSGDVDRAIEFMADMPVEPDAKMLGSLLAACREHRRVELSEYLSHRLLEMEPSNPAIGVALSNAYAAEARWEEVSRTRGSMREKGMKKDPGVSWIQVGTDVRTFVAGDKSHPETEKLYRVLQIFRRQMGEVEETRDL